MLIENLNEPIQSHLADHPSQLGAAMIRNQKGKCTPTGSYRWACSSEARQSDMDDDSSSEGDFILASPIATFKVFGTDRTQQLP
jgi:hypothetical protein